MNYLYKVYFFSVVLMKRQYFYKACIIDGLFDGRLPTAQQTRASFCQPIMPKPKHTPVLYIETAVGR